jgi:hypothetical protein
MQTTRTSKPPDQDLTPTDSNAIEPSLASACVSPKKTYGISQENDEKHSIFGVPSLSQFHANLHNVMCAQLTLPHPPWRPASFFGARSSAI